MIRRHGLLFAALALTMLGVLAGPTRGLAQINCVCDSITINVDRNVGCKVSVCVLPTFGARICITISPGTRGRLPCIPGAVFIFRDCHGNGVPFTPGPDGCHIGIGVGPNCCVIDACLDNSVDCPVINVRPSIIDSCPCL